jgi:hypothetical protein
MESTNGVVSRSLLLTLSMPCRLTRVTFAPGLDDGRHLRRARERQQVVAENLRAGRDVVRVRLGPAVTRQDASRGVIDVVRPGRERADMRPFGDGRADLVAGFENAHGDAALDQVGRRGKPDRAAADHRDGQVVDVTRHDALHIARVE